MGFIFITIQSVTEQAYQLMMMTLNHIAPSMFEYFWMVILHCFINFIHQFNCFSHSFIMISFNLTKLNPSCLIHLPFIIHLILRKIILVINFIVFVVNLMD